MHTSRLHRHAQNVHNSIIHVSIFLFGEGNGNPLQYSCQENSMGGGALLVSELFVSLMKIVTVTFISFFPTNMSNSM